MHNLHNYTLLQVCIGKVECGNALVSCLLVLYHCAWCMVCSVLNNHVVWNGKWNVVLYV